MTLTDENRALKEQIKRARQEKRRVLRGLQAEIERRDGALELALMPDDEFHRC